MKPQRLSRTVIYESSWVNLYSDRVQLPDGRIIERHHVLDFPKNAVAVIVENESGDLLLIQAYRYVLDTISWELPAGTLEKGETVFEGARREAREETGYEVTTPEFVYTYYPMNGIANQVFHVLKCKAVKSSGDFDRNEVKEVKWVSVGEVREMIGSGSIKDGFSLTALLLYLVNREG